MNVMGESIMIEENEGTPWCLELEFRHHFFGSFLACITGPKQDPGAFFRIWIIAKHFVQYVSYLPGIPARRHY